MAHPNRSKLLKTLRDKLKKGSSSTIPYSLEPEYLKRALRTAEFGNTITQSKIATTIFEKDTDIKAFFQVRQGAVASKKWKIKPASDSQKDIDIAARLDDMLRTMHPHASTGFCNFRQFIRSSVLADLYGYRVFEMDWKEDGSAIKGFKHYQEDFFNLNENGWPTLGDDTLNSDWFLCHLPDPCQPQRSGLVRQLSVLYLLSHPSLFAYASYIEKFGLPLILAMTDELDDDDSDAVYDLLNEFAGEKFGMFERDSVEIDIKESTGQGADVHEKFLGFIRRRVSMLIIGSDSGLSDAGSSRRAFDSVRNDITNETCLSLADTINSQIVEPWTDYNFGDAPRPTFEFDLRVARDATQAAGVVSTLPGYEFNDKEVSEKIGFSVTKKEEPQEDM